jgi:hypothetical protein
MKPTDRRGYKFVSYTLVVLFADDTNKFGAGLQGTLQNTDCGLARSDPTSACTHSTQNIQGHAEQIHARIFLHFLYGITARTKDKPCSERGGRG